MEITTLMRCAVVGVGLILAGSSVWFYAKKKMISDLAAAWCLLGADVMAVGAIPPFSRWLNLISVWTGIALLGVGAAALLGAFRICLMISRSTSLKYPSCRCGTRTMITPKFRFVVLVGT